MPSFIPALSSSDARLFLRQWAYKQQCAVPGPQAAVSTNWYCRAGLLKRLQNQYGKPTKIYNVMNLAAQKQERGKVSLERLAEVFGMLHYFWLPHRPSGMLPSCRGFVLLNLTLESLLLATFFGFEASVPQAKFICRSPG
jgi:hypothetical protein